MPFIVKKENAFQVTPPEMEIIKGGNLEKLIAKGEIDKGLERILLLLNSILNPFGVKTVESCSGKFFGFHYGDFIRRNEEVKGRIEEILKKASEGKFEFYLLESTPFYIDFAIPDDERAREKFEEIAKILTNFNAQIEQRLLQSRSESCLLHGVIFSASQYFETCNQIMEIIAKVSSRRGYSEDEINEIYLSALRYLENAYTIRRKLEKFIYSYISNLPFRERIKVKANYLKRRAKVMLYKAFYRIKGNKRENRDYIEI